MAARPCKVPTEAADLSYAAIHVEELAFSAVGKELEPGLRSFDGF